MGTRFFFTSDYNGVVHGNEKNIDEKEMEKKYPGRIKEKPDWKGLFRSDILEDAKKKVVQDTIKSFRETYYPRGFSAEMGVGRGRVNASILNPPQDLGDKWEDSKFYCNCKHAPYCVHTAAVLFRMEKDFGPLILWEPEYKYRSRIAKEQAEKKRAERDKIRMNAGGNLLPALDFFKNQKKENFVFFDFKEALSGFKTYEFSITEAKALRNNANSNCTCEISETREGVKSLRFHYHDSNDYEIYDISGAICEKEFVILYEILHINMGNYWDSNAKEINYLEDNTPLDAYALAAIKVAWNYSAANSGGDQTDDAAEKFFKNLAVASEKAEKTEQIEILEKPKREIVDLQPRIIIEDGIAKLSFKLGKGGKRLYVLKNLPELVQCVRSETTMEITKKESIDFSELTFREDSLPLYHFIERRVGEIGAVNEKLAQRANSYAYGGYSSSLNRAFAVEYQQPLKGSLLDAFYEVYEGKSCEFQDKTNGIKDSAIKVGHIKMRFRLRSQRLADARGTFAGVAVSGFIPVMIKGSSFNYTLNSSALSRISKEEEEVLKPFRSVADASGYFRFQVGQQRLNEFYYRVLPNLLENPSVDMEDECAEEAELYLPPEPHFVFFLDYAEDMEELYLRCMVSYEDRSYYLHNDAGTRWIGDSESTMMNLDNEGKDNTEDGTIEGNNDIKDDKKDTDIKADNIAVKKLSNKPNAEPNNKPDNKLNVKPNSKSDNKLNKYATYHDTVQEKRVGKTLNRLFPEYKKETETFLKSADSDELYEFLQSGVSKLEHYGEIRGTEVFRRQRIRPTPTVQLGISVESGLMDLSVTSKELSPDELIEILECYRLKKKYYRLKSGEFLDILHSTELGEIESLLGDMELVPTDVIKNKAHLPLYRALYLDRMLEDHEEIVTSRDRIYRNLVKNFHTLKDADYEPPKDLQEVLRPYQSYGFKWLKTLESAGFGGILADEMGLGKTIQMISVFMSDPASPPSLVVCPASLVFNWKEEIRRFAPEIRTTTLTGNVASRKKALEALSETDVFVVSYDLLKRDIALYENVHFNNIVLDEAQYIKNSKAAVSKSVKVLKADHRYALTGTPIENRLSELHSIFDFLMPGFLYDQKSFEKKFETPIVKEKDEKITERLKRMTSPFILRRLKKDVLKDLPPKLEEVRYAEIKGEQQKVYDAQVVRMKQMLAGAGDLKGEERIRIFAELTRIREICCDPSLLFDNYHGESAKREACLELVKNAIDGGHRMLLFSQFTSMLELLEGDLKREGIEYYKIIGATPKEKRLSMVHAFNEGDVPVFLISLKAGGTGLNLTGADMVIHYDPWWNLAAQNQATDRAHRIGQKRQVTVFKLIIKNTIEEKILEMQEAKKDLADAILEGKGESLMSLSSEELLELLE